MLDTNGQNLVKVEKIVAKGTIGKERKGKDFSSLLIIARLKKKSSKSSIRITLNEKKK